MNIEEFKKTKLPAGTGVYFFRDKQREILYIGKATNLQSRVRSYFDKNITSTRGWAISNMVNESKVVNYKETDSVLEALILEANLIKKYQPKYNVKEKSNKSFNYIAITKEDFPRVLTIREHELLGVTRLKSEFLYTLGPFPQGSVLKEALKVIRKIFPFRDKCKPMNGKPCFNRQINLCPGVCSGEITKTEYRKIISNLKLFFEGKKKRLVTKLEKEMSLCAKKQEFERATKLKKTIFSLKHIQDISLLKDNPRKGEPFVRMEGYDVAHLAGGAMVGVMTALVDGEIDKNEYRKFNIKTVSSINDIASLEEVLIRRFSHKEWEYPKLIVVDGGKQQKNVAERTMKELGLKIPIVAVVKDNKHKPKDILGESEYARKYKKEILLANAEAHRFSIAVHRKKMRKDFI